MKKQRCGVLREMRRALQDFLVTAVTLVEWQDRDKVAHPEPSTAKHLFPFHTVGSCTGVEGVDRQAHWQMTHVTWNLSQLLSPTWFIYVMRARPLSTRLDVKRMVMSLLGSDPTLVFVKATCSRMSVCPSPCSRDCCFLVLEIPFANRVHWPPVSKHFEIISE